MGLKNLTRREAIRLKAKGYAKEYVGESLSEGVEEIVNAIGTNEGNSYEQQQLLGSKDDRNFFERVGEYLQDPNTWRLLFGVLRADLFFQVELERLLNLEMVMIFLKIG